MKLLFTTYRYGQITNDVYHCDEVQEFPEYDRIYAINPDIKDLDAIPSDVDALDVFGITVVAGDSFMVFTCESTCPRHGDPASINRSVTEAEQPSPLGGDCNGSEDSGTD